MNQSVLETVALNLVLLVFLLFGAVLVVFVQELWDRFVEAYIEEIALAPVTVFPARSSPVVPVYCEVGIPLS